VNIMNELVSTTPSTSGEGGVIVQGVPLVPEAVVEVTNLAGDYEGLWLRVEGGGGGGGDQQDIRV